MKKGLFCLIMSIAILGASIFPTFATNKNTPNNLHIIPTAAGDTETRAIKGAMIVDLVWSGKTESDGRGVIERYNEQAKDIEDDWDLWMAFQTWVMSWNTLLNYVVYLMRFLNQIGILIGAIMILYAGYLYATSVFKLWDVNKAKNAIASAIKGVLIIVFSYAIWRALWMFFL